MRRKNQIVEYIRTNQWPFIEVGFIAAIKENKKNMISVLQISSKCSSLVIYF